MKRLLTCICVLLCLCLTTLTAAAATSLPGAQLQAAAAHPYWQRLLHLDEQGHSRVDDPRFFLAPNGATDALAELIATLDQADQVLSGDANQHPRCRLPARYRWLQEQGLLPPSAPPRCGDYAQWQQQTRAERVSLIFPAAYMNSPSSMYGHTFLRFDPPAAEQDSLWLSWALNFGANISADDNSLLYVYKGVFGGYPGQFNMLPYYRKIQEYNRLENRDMWEYPLNLTPAEVERLLQHVWELKDINFDYFFFDENCSFQLLELLDLIRPDAQLTAAFDWHAIPADTVRAVVRAGMTTGVAYRPSNRSRFDALLAELDVGERRALLRLSHDPTTQAAWFTELPPPRQRLLAQGAYDYLRLSQDGGVRDAEANRRSYQLLQRINRLGRAELPQPALPTDPVEGHYSGLVRAGVGQRSGRNFTELGFRIAYQDLLDAEQGFPSGAELEMGELALRRYNDDRIAVEQLQLVSIRSLTPRSALFQPWSWQVNAGMERIYTDVSHPHTAVAQLTAGGGVSYAAQQERTRGFALLLGRLEFSPARQDEMALGGGLSLGGRHDFGAVQAMLEASLIHMSTGELRQRLDLGVQYNLTRQSGLRGSFSHRQHDDGRFDNTLLLEYRHHLL